MRQATRLSSTIEALRPRFLAQTEERLQRVLALRPDLEANVRIEGAVNEIRSAAHKTSGIAATLGFAALGRSAQEVDEALSSYSETSLMGPLPRVQVSLVDAFAEMMVDALGSRSTQARARVRMGGPGR